MPAAPSKVVDISDYLRNPDVQASLAGVQFAEMMKHGAKLRGRTDDSFQNFQLQLGIGTDNALSGSTYGFNPITRNRTLLEWMHRGAWLAGQAVDLVGDDMTREGVEITSTIDAKDRDVIDSELSSLGVWAEINDTVRWARLYGGAVAVMLIDGHDMSQPLELNRIERDSFKGLLSLDRWSIDPQPYDLVEDFGPYMGTPRYYRVNTNSPGLRGKTVHYSRVIRMEGIRLPWQQRQFENSWGISVLERLYDRMVAFDSATQGAAQLVYKAFLRTYKIKDLRKNIAGNEDILNNLVQYVETMRRFQSNEGITLIDGEDDLAAVGQTSFTGIADALMQFGQQLAGALQIPLVRLFGMSPAGFSSTGESDLRTYYDGINQQQKRTLLVPMGVVIRLIAASKRIELGDDFQYRFRPLWQLPEEQKAATASTITSTVADAVERLGIDGATALRELKRQSSTTGVWSTISDEQIDEAEKTAAEGPPPINEMAPPTIPNAAANEDFGAEGGEQELEGVETDGEPTYYRFRDSAGAFVAGLPVVIETPRGTTRYPYSRQLPCHYGFFAGSLGADGEACDCFVGPERDPSFDAYAIWTVDPESGRGDEWKVALGYPSRTLALRDFSGMYDDGSGPARVGSVHRMSIDQLKDWLAEGHGARGPG